MDKMTSLTEGEGCVSLVCWQEGGVATRKGADPYSIPLFVVHPERLELPTLRSEV